MFGLDQYQTIFVVNAFLFQLLLIVHFALRKWAFDLAMRYGRIIYALSIPAAAVSIYLLRAGWDWSYYAGGLIYLAWSVFGYIVEYVLRIEWRNSLRWSILTPYVLLYLATVMFYWWPLAHIYKPLWFVFTALFLVSTFLNLTSHNVGASTLSAQGVKRAV